MNGITLLSATPTQLHNVHLNGDKNINPTSLTIFKNVLAGIEFGTVQKTEVPVKPEEPDLNVLLAQLVSELSATDHKLDEELLMTPFAEQLINQLPLELQLEIEAIFNGNSNIENLLGDGQGLKNPSQLIVLAIKMSQYMKRDLVQGKQNDFEHVLVKLLDQLKNILSEKGMLDQNLQGQKSNLNRQEFIFAAINRASASNDISSSQVGIPNIQGQPLNQVHQFLLHVGESRGEQQNGEQLLRQFKNILDRSSLLQFPNGLNKLTIKLFPQHLGRLDVTLTQQHGVIIAQLMTTTKAAKNAIESQLQQLRQAFLSQNIQVEKIEVFTQQQQSLLLPDKQNQEEKNNSHDNKKQKEQNDDGEKVNFQDFLNETFNVEV